MTREPLPDQCQANQRDRRVICNNMATVIVGRWRLCHLCAQVMPLRIMPQTDIDADAGTAGRRAANFAFEKVKRLRAKAERERADA